jgi:hypothetical protein
MGRDILLAASHFRDSQVRKAGLKTKESQSDHVAHKGELADHIKL